MALEHPGWVLMASATAIVGLYLLTARPTAWRAIYFSLPLIALLFADYPLRAIREQKPWGWLTVMAIAAIFFGIFIVREYLGPTESWVIHNARREEIRAALERVLQRYGIPFEWRRHRLQLPTIGIGGSALLIHGGFGLPSVEVVAADRDERRIATNTVLPLLREELSRLPRPIIPWSGVFCLAHAALMLALATHL